MRSNQLFRRILVLALILFNLGCDQVSKEIARKHLDYHETIPVIQNRFNLIKVENYGAFLSSGDSLPPAFKFVLLSLLPLLVLFYGLYFLMNARNLDRLFMMGISCIVGGGAGNLYDRLRYGSVTDFMHMDLVIFQTGVFNVADLSIMVGMVMVLINVYNNKLRTTTS